MSDYSTKLRDQDFDINCAALVEASAGTGKTYNIQNAYLRIILQEEISVEELLVVTFTEAATHELRDRLRKILSAARDELEGRDTEEEPRIRDLLAAADIDIKDTGQRDQAVSNIKLALMNFDYAPVSTIHGFCKSVLERYSFECGHDPLAELTADESDIILKVCHDWWRQNTYINPEFRENVPFETVDELFSSLKEYIHKPAAKLEPHIEDEDRQQIKNNLNESIAALKAQLENDNDYLDGIAIPEGCSLKEKSDYIRTTSIFANVPYFLNSNELPQQAAERFHELGDNLRGTITWNADGNALIKQNEQVDVSSLQQAAASEDITTWRTRIQPYLKLRNGQPVKAADALLDALQTLTDTNADAKVYAKAMKTVSEFNSQKVFGRKLCDVMPELNSAVLAYDECLIADKAHIIQSLADRTRKNIKNRSILTYDNMLLNVQQALQGEHGGHLKQVLQGEYKAAMIDEFQDTDPIQYSIFTDLFMEAGVPLVFVGDPKQAIYGFRGGDIFTYYRAKEEVGEAHMYGLGTNYRSETRMIQAVNQLFKDKEDDPTFRNESIQYPGNLQANGVPAAKQFHDENSDIPFHIWRYQYTALHELYLKPGMKHPLVDAVNSHVADEVVRLITDEGCKIGDRPVEPRDIAVLVHTHTEAEAIYKKLKERSVNAVRQNTGNVFDSEEALDMLLILRALLTPSNAYTVRSALTASMLPCSPAHLVRICFSDDDTPPHTENNNQPAVPGHQSPQTLNEWTACFKEAGERWRERSFIEAFNMLMRRTGMRAHLVSQPDGERSLTNTLHLAELVHQTSFTKTQGPAALVDWHARQLNKETREESDEYLMRLSSDENAVKIMTVFKSKGLEFPIVFVPSLWRKKAEAKRKNSRMYSYHDDEGAHILNLNSDDETAREKAKTEQLQEDIRLIYVAATRAVNRVYLIHISDIEGGGYVDTYALDWVLSRMPPEADAVMVTTREAPAPEPVVYDRRMSGSPENLSVCGEARVDHSHGHSSFSALEPGTGELQDTAEVRDVDSQAGDAENGVEESIIEEDIFSIPGGERTGTCWHEIFETVDFTDTDDHIKAVTRAALDRYRICRGATDEITRAREEAVYNMVMQTLRTRLPAHGDQPVFCLNELDMRARKSELEFNFSLVQDQHLRTPAIKEVIARHWSGRESKEAFVDALNTWDRQLPRGFMTGFIDLVACYDNRFYIIDWKSNRRTGRLDDFGTAGLNNEMARNAYFLQYLIYTVALNGYLQKHLEGYTYDTHFGGVFYVFLRGIEHEQTHGIFSDRPSSEMIEDLSALLTGTGGSP